MIAGKNVFFFHFPSIQFFAFPFFLPAINSCPRSPVVVERKIRTGRPGRPTRQRRSPLLDEVGQVITPPPPPQPRLPYNILTTWRLSDIDFPACLAYFEFDYYDTMYNESAFKKVMLTLNMTNINFLHKYL